MNLSELAEQINDLLEEHGDVEVRLMTQAHWPFENQLDGVCHSSEFADDCECECEEETCVCEFDDDPNMVFLVEGRQLKYGNKAAWDAI